MGNYTRDEVLQMAEDEDVEFIRLQFTDMFGTLKNIAITARELPRALDNEYVVDSSYIAGIAGEKEQDIIALVGVGKRSRICICIRTTIPSPFFRGVRSREK